jgi:hypothetical protein
VNAGMSATFGASYTADISGGVTIERKKVKPHHSQEHQFVETSSDFQGMAGAATLTITPRLAVKIAGFAGPTLTVSAGLDAKVTPGADPWWTLDARVRALVGGEVKFFGIDAEVTQRLFDETYRIAQAPLSSIAPPPPGA